MRTYEKDTELKIPKIYYKIPLRFLDVFCDIGLVINRIMPRVRKEDTSRGNKKNKRNVTFYL